MNEPKRVSIYARVSSDRQDVDLSISAQLKALREYVRFLESSNIFERRAFLGTFIESLEVDDGEITFNYGLPPDGAKQETVSVPGIVPSGPPK
jgi:hypothetical protein